VLDRLEPADRAVELHPLLRVGDGELGEAVGQPELERGGEHGARQVPSEPDLERRARRQLVRACDRRARIEWPW